MFNTQLATKNTQVLFLVFAFVGGMVGLAYASVPLYDLFCRVTGFGGTTQVSEAAPIDNIGTIEREVNFNRHVMPALAWSVEAPASLEMVAGDQVTILYKATNLSDEAVTGTSSFNVTPNKIGVHFMKLECFCFTEQTLEAGESVEMPVTFYLDPDIDTDKNTTEVPEITLSYTFFPVMTEKG